MKPEILEAKMRRLEVYHNLEVLPGAYAIVRVDGRSFSKLTRGMEHPFDTTFHICMVEAARALLVELGGTYAYTESDEISLLIPRETDLFGRSVEKIVSVSAGIASSVFSVKSGMLGHFDSRLWVGPTSVEVIDYFQWRQADATRCCLNSWCYWTLRREGKSAQQATKLLEKQKSSFKNELLFNKGINFNNLPAWQRRGVGIYRSAVAKTGFNPKKNISVETTRYQTIVDKGLPFGSGYEEFLRKICNFDR